MTSREIAVAAGRSPEFIKSVDDFQRLMHMPMCYVCGSVALDGVCECVFLEAQEGREIAAEEIVRLLEEATIETL